MEDIPIAEQIQEIRLVLSEQREWIATMRRLINERKKRWPEEDLARREARLTILEAAAETLERLG